jgi:hypothetical protein
MKRAILVLVLLAACTPAEEPRAERPERAPWEKVSTELCTRLSNQINITKCRLWVGEGRPLGQIGEVVWYDRNSLGRGCTLIRNKGQYYRYCFRPLL